MSSDTQELVRTLHPAVIHLDTLQANDYEYVRKVVGDARIVMIGEATHGTHEFYKIRAEISKYLVEHCNFNFVCCEADWVDMYEVNRFVQQLRSSSSKNVREAFSEFTRYPKWMWRNEEVISFANWMKEYNDKLSPGNPKCGIYGVDVYGTSKAAEQIIKLLKKIDPEAGKLAEERYNDFIRYGENHHRYWQEVKNQVIESKETDVMMGLIDLLENGPLYLSAELINNEELFFLMQCGHNIKNGEEYSRNYDSDGGGEVTWNIRDQHMTECTLMTLNYYDEVLQRLDKLGKKEDSSTKRVSRGIVWAHNSHLGDAGATIAGCERHELNLGQLLRQRVGLDSCFSIGFTTYDGHVVASDHWNGPLQVFSIHKAFPESIEDVFHKVTLVLKQQRLREKSEANMLSNIPMEESGDHIDTNMDQNADGDAENGQYDNSDGHHNLDGNMNRSSSSEEDRSSLNNSNNGNNLHISTDMDIDDNNNNNNNMNNQNIDGETENSNNNNANGDNNNNDGDVNGDNNYQNYANTETTNPFTDFAVLMRSNNKTVVPDNAAVRALMRARMQRMIGVQYKKDTEIPSHYFECFLPYQFDMMIHIDRTSGVHYIDNNDNN